MEIVAEHDRQHEDDHVAAEGEQEEDREQVDEKREQPRRDPGGMAVQVVALRHRRLRWKSLDMLRVRAGPAGAPLPGRAAAEQPIDPTVQGGVDSDALAPNAVDHLNHHG